LGTNYESKKSFISCQGITKNPNENDYLLVFHYDELNDNLSKTFGEVTWKYKIDELINKLLDSLNKLLDSLNKLVNKSYIIIVTKLSNELFETLTIIEDCSSCKNNIGKCNLDEFHELRNEIENFSIDPEEEEQVKKDMIVHLNKTLIYIDDELNRRNRKVLCEGCERKKIEKLTDKCENEEISRFLYRHAFIDWIPFNEFRNIKLLAKGDSGKIYKAIWICYYYEGGGFEELDVVLKNVHSSDINFEEVKI